MPTDNLWEKYGYTEEYFLATMEKVLDKIASSYTFGINGRSDIKQQAYIIALESLRDGLFRPERCDNRLDKFLYVHLKNRLFNFRRDKNYRPQSPCKVCPLFDPHRRVSDNQCTQFSEKFDCTPYREWRQREGAKASLMSPKHFSDLKSEPHITPAKQSDLRAKIDRELPACLRSTYLKMVEGLKVSHADRAEVREAIREILMTDENYSFYTQDET
jgi:hypothetical protein